MGIVSHFIIQENFVTLEPTVTRIDLDTQTGEKTSHYVDPESYKQYGPRRLKLIGPKEISEKC